MKSKLFSGGSPLGEGIWDADLSNPALIDFVSAYRRRVAGNYRPLRPEEIDNLPQGRFLVSSKIDGELWFLVTIDNQAMLVNSNGKTIAGNIPVLKQAVGLPDGVVIAGELHAITEDKRARVGDLAAIMAGGKNAKVDKICFSAFDLLRDIADKEQTTAYDSRHSRISNLIKEDENLKVIPFDTFSSTSQIRALFEKSVITGEIEGIVIRLDGGLIYKLKPEINIDAAIIAFTTKTDQPDLARSVLLGLIDSENNFQILGGCGNLGSEADRRNLLTKLLPLKTNSNVRYASESGALYTFVKPEIVATVKMSDLQLYRSDGSTAKSMRIIYDQNGWQNLGASVCPRPIHPVLDVLRADKSVNQHDVRFSQIESYMPIKSSEGRVPQVSPESKLLRREVWTKETKGQIAVRKLLVWQTNKEKIDPIYPAYVVHWTDYSGSRATPLEREVRLAPSDKLAMSIADDLINENIKKGWNKV